MSYTRNTSALAAKSGNNKFVYKDILTALADATNGLCREQRTVAATVYKQLVLV